MLIRINEQPITIGEPVETEILERADLRRSGLLKRLLPVGKGESGRREAENCSVDCFEGAFNLYPCTHGYLTPDRQWQTMAEIELRDGRVVSVLFKVVKGRYAATEFADRFRASCQKTLGDPYHADRYTARWRNGAAEITSVLQFDAMNASFLFAEKSTVD